MGQANSLIIGYAELIIAASLAASTIVLGYLNYIRGSKLKKLEDENEHLKAEIHKESGKVNPESDRLLLNEAEKSVQIMGINALGPLHHCMEEIITCLSQKIVMQVLLLDPSSVAFRERERKEGDSSNRLASEWMASITILKDIQGRSAQAIELRVRAEQPDRSLFIIDAIGGSSDRTEMLINYYPDQPGMRGYSGAQFLAKYVMERDRDSILKNIEFFKQSWKQAKPISIDEALDLVFRHTQMNK